MAYEHQDRELKEPVRHKVSKETLLLGSLRVEQGVRKETPSMESAGLGDLHGYFGLFPPRA